MTSTMHPADVDKIPGTNTYTAPTSTSTTTSTGVKVLTPDAQDGWVLPVPDYTEWNSGSFMPNTKNHRGRTHPGLDIYANEGSAIVSPVSGEIVASGYGETGGNWVKIMGDDGYEYYFAHMQYPATVTGGRVTAGTQIGMVGNTGSAESTKPHLHFTVKTLSGDVVNPISLMENGVSVAEASQTSGGGSTEAVSIPTGGQLFEVDGTQYVVFTITGNEGASAQVYYEIAPGHSYAGQPSVIVQSSWDIIAGRSTDGGDTNAFTGVKAGTSWDDIIEQTLYQMGIYGSDALSDSGVLQVIGEFIGRPDMSPEEMDNRLRQTDWWAQHTDKQRTWNDKSDAQKSLEIVDAASQLAGVWFTYTGQNINVADFDLDGNGTVTVDELKQGNPQLAQYAEQIASGVSTQPMVINTWIKDEALKDPESPWSRTQRNEEIARGQFDVDVETKAGEVLDMYRQYGLDLSWDEALRMGNKLAMNQVSMEELTNKADEMAMALYPNKPPGMTTRAWAQPYTQQMMNTLELPDSDLSDPVLQRALAEGMTLGDFRKQLKSDERWLNTKNARDEFNSTLSGLGNQMGF